MADSLRQMGKETREAASFMKPLSAWVKFGLNGYPAIENEYRLSGGDSLYIYRRREGREEKGRRGERGKAGKKEKLRPE